MLKLKLASSDVCATVAAERPSRMEGPDKMSPTLSLEESIREFRNNHVRLKLRRSSLSPASFADEGGQFPVCILDKTILFTTYFLQSTFLTIHCKWFPSGSGYPQRRGSQEGYQPQSQSQQGSAWIHRFLRGGGEIFSLMPKADANPFIILCTFAIINIFHKSSGLFAASGCAKRRQPQTEAVLDIIIGYGVVGRDCRRGDTTTMR